MKNMTKEVKDTVRLSFNVLADEHIVIKTECIKLRAKMKDFLHELVMLGLKDLQEQKLQESLRESVKQAKDGKTVAMSKRELNRWKKHLEK